MTDVKKPDFGNIVAVLQALSNPSRLRVLTEVAKTREEGKPCTVASVSAALEMPVKSLMKEIVRLEQCGLIEITGSELFAQLGILDQHATSLLASLPITHLLSQDPDLERYFRQGRLDGIPEKYDVRSRLAALIVQLLPRDRSITEAEVNAELRQVHDDFAALRRMLVDHHKLTRNGSADYRRID